MAGVELDDSSHRETRRQERDAFVDSVFKSAGLPLLHVPAQAAYNQSELRASIADVIRPPAAAPAA